MVDSETVGARWRSFVRRFVRDRDAYDPETRQRLDIVLGLELVCLPIHLLRAATFASSHDYTQASLHIAAGVLTLLALWPLRRGHWMVAGNLMVAALVFPGHGLALRTIGYDSPELTTLLFIPFLATLVAGRGWGLGWAVITSGLALGHALRSDIFAGDAATSSARPLWFMMGVPYCFYLVSLVYEWTKESAFEARRQAERLQFAAEEETRMLRADRMAVMGQMVASFAHEINNPLTYVVVNVDLVREALNRLGPETSVERSQEDLDQAITGLSAIRNIVADIQTYAHAGTGDEAEIDLHETVATAARMASGAIKSVTRLEIDVPASLPRVRARHGHLGQVVLNLVINAAHAMDENNLRTNVIRIEGRQNEAGDVSLRVVDNGCGMTDEVRARALEPLFTTKPPGVGTGLGLFVCDKIVRELGGSLDIESRVGVGTTIQIVIPKDRVVAATMSGVSDHSVAQSPGAT